MNQGGGVSVDDLVGLSGAATLTGTGTGKLNWKPAYAGIGLDCAGTGAFDFSISLTTKFQQYLVTTASVVYRLRVRGTNATAGIGYLGAETIAGFYPFTGHGYFSEFRSARLDAIAIDTGILANWHVLTVTSSPGAGNYKVYQNAVLITTATGDATIAVNPAPALGYNGSNGDLDGALDYVILWNRAITHEEIAYLSCNPYCFMQPQSPQRRYFIGSSAPRRFWLLTH